MKERQSWLKKPTKQMQGKSHEVPITTDVELVAAEWARARNASGMTDVDRDRGMTDAELAAECARLRRDKKPEEILTEDLARRVAEALAQRIADACELVSDL